MFSSTSSNSSSSSSTAESKSSSEGIDTGFMTHPPIKTSPGKYYARVVPAMAGVKQEYHDATETAAEEYGTMVTGMTDQQVAELNATIRDINELNGTGDVAGVAASFIRESDYYQDFTLVKVGPALKKALMLAYNFRACGRGNGGLCGAAVRYQLREFYQPGRETTVHEYVPGDALDAIEEYKNALNGKEDLVNFFMTNALSVAALAGALMNKTGHHWNAEHKAPQIAFVNSLGMKDFFQDQDYRKVFYLAIHPLPLRYTEELRVAVADGKLAEVAEVVRMRAGGPPCGFGVVNVCAAAVQSLMNEPFMDPNHYTLEAELPIDLNSDQATITTTMRRNRDIAKNNRERELIVASLPEIAVELKLVSETNARLCQNASRYHMFATYYGHDKREFLDMVPLTRAMVLLTAYIMSKVGGTLSRSPALMKFQTQHARAVQKAINAFNTQVEGESMADILSSSFLVTAAAHANPAQQHVNANSQQDGVA